MQISKETENCWYPIFLQHILILSSSGAFSFCLLPGCDTYYTLPTQNTKMHAFSVIWPALVCLGTFAQDWQISPESCRRLSLSGTAAANQLFHVWLSLLHNRKVTFKHLRSESCITSPQSIWGLAVQHMPRAQAVSSQKIKSHLPGWSIQPWPCPPCRVPRPGTLGQHFCQPGPCSWPYSPHHSLHCQPCNNSKAFASLEVHKKDSQNERNSFCNTLGVQRKLYKTYY